MARFYKYIFPILFVLSCATTGPVQTDHIDSQLLVPEPKEFKSPIKAINDLFFVAEQLESKLPAKNPMKNKNWNEYLSYREAYETEDREQTDLENELYHSGEITLEPGHSYEFDLQTYCVNAGKSRPLAGDGFQIGKLKGPAEKWLPWILRSEIQDTTTHEQIQSLIWALLTDVRFDELSVGQQQLLIKIFPNAVIKFGNRHLENLGQELLKENFPEISDGIDQIRSLRNEYLSFRDNFEELQNRFAPPSDRTIPIPVGWMRMNDGYYLKVTSSDEFRAVHISIYVPEEKRSPNVTDEKLSFKPWQWIVLPSEGQRLGLSVKSVRTQKTLKKDICSEFKNWRPVNCRDFADEDRQTILKLADPSNFPKTRYQKPPRRGTKIEEETDCSHFVQEIYSRAGFKFPYSPTSSFSCLSLFRPMPMESAQMGDIVLYDGHVAVYAGNGKVISPTVGGSRELSKLPIDRIDFKPAITIDPQTAFRNGRLLKWECPK